MSRRSQAGLTLIELMVVVVIIGVASTIAAVKLGRDADLRGVANELSLAVGEASRKAVAHGPVDATVIAAEGFTARARLLVDVDAEGNQYFAVELRNEESADASTWLEVERRTLPASMEIAGVESGVARTEPGEGTPVAVPADGFAVECESSGQCQAATIYFQTTGTQVEQLRVVVMPLAAAPLVLANW